MSRAVLSIGSNMGERLGYLRGAATYFSPWLVKASAVYETPPWGPVAQDSFLNAVLIVDDPAADAHTWLRRSLECEQRAARHRGVRWGPRTLDVDVIVVDDERSDDPELTLPHPRAQERAFVLVPWLQADPAASLPTGSVAQLVGGLSSSERAAVQPQLGLSLLTNADMDRLA